MQTQGPETGELADASAPIMLPPPRANDAWAQPGGEPNNAPGQSRLRRLRQCRVERRAGPARARQAAYRGRRLSITDTSTRSMPKARSPRSPIGRVRLVARVAEPTAKRAAAGTRLTAAAAAAVTAAALPSTAAGYTQRAASAPSSHSIRQAARRCGRRTRGAGARLADRRRRPHFRRHARGPVLLLAGADGGELWAVRGLPQQASLIKSASPAVDGDIVVVPYPSGDLVALRVADGSSVWSESLARTRTTSQLASMSDTARPAIEAGRCSPSGMPAA